jgi:dipeptidyl aminopeptidase/acylaminoacyl peptidase
VLVSPEIDDADRGWIYVLNVDSGVRQRLLRGADPQVAPNGQIAFTRSTKTGHSPAGELQLWTSNHSVEKLLVTLRGTVDELHYMWSPDSSRILYWYIVPDVTSKNLGNTLRTAEGASVRIFPGTYRYPYVAHFSVCNVAQGTCKDVLQHSGETGGAGWIDKSKIFLEKDDGKPASEMQSQVVEINVADAAQRVLISGLNKQAVYSPLSNPSSGKIAFLGDPESAAFYPIRTDLGVFDLRTGDIQFVTRNAWVGSSFSWTPDGRRLIFSSGPSTEYNIWTSDLQRPASRVTSGIGEDLNPSVSSDGALLAWIHRTPDEESSVRVMTLASATQFVSRTVQILKRPFAAGELTTLPLKWQSDDGLFVDGFLSVPHDWRKEVPYPVVVIIHGGPSGGVSPITDEWPGGPCFIRYLVHQGYAVFQPDYRTGQRFGFDKLLAQRESDLLFQKDMEDIMSGVRNLAQQGIADPSRLALIGHSWGSSEANWILTHTNLFAAAVSYEGVDLVMDWGTRFGPNRAFEWFLRDSPIERPAIYRQNWALSFTKGVRTPTLFVSSTAESGTSKGLEWMYSAWISQGVDAQYLNYPGESHVISNLDNQVDLLERIITWLRDHGVR